MNEGMLLRRMQNFQEERYSDYPKEKLGVADRFLLNRVVREDSRIFPLGERSYNLMKSVNDEMKRFGYIGKPFDDC